MTKGKGRTPGAGGLDKHIKRDAHKERQQLPWREGLGGLEKHQDHARRAKRRHAKVAKLQTLKRAAANRNPDEFNIAMTKKIVDVATGRVKQRSSCGDRGKRMAAREDRLKQNLVDNVSNANYLSQQARRDRSRAAELLADTGAGALLTTTSGARSKLLGGGSVTTSKHTIFVNDSESFDKFDAAAHFNTRPELLQYPGMRGTLDRLGALVADEDLDRDTSSGSFFYDSGGSSSARRSARRAAQTARQLAAYTTNTHNDDGDSNSVDNDDDDAMEDGGEGVDAAPTAAELAELAAVERKRATVKSLREITQRTNRAATLDRLVSGVKQDITTIKNKLSVKDSNKFRHSARVRSR